MLVKRGLGEYVRLHPNKLIEVSCHCCPHDSYGGGCRGGIFNYNLDSGRCVEGLGSKKCSANLP